MSFLNDHTTNADPARFKTIGYDRRDDSTKPRYSLIDFDLDTANIWFHVAGERHLRRAAVLSLVQCDDEELENFSAHDAFQLGMLAMGVQR